MLYRIREANAAAIDEPHAVSISDYLDNVDSAHGKDSAADRTVRLIARSADSIALKSIWKQLQAMRTRGIKVVAVITGFGCKADRNDVLGRYAEIFGPNELAENIRIAEFRNADKMGEQLQLGAAGVWIEDGTAKAHTNEELEVVGADGFLLSAARISFEMAWVMSEKVNYRPVVW